MENPTNHTTSPQAPVFRWVEGPKVRGTFDILAFCFSTLVVCVWSALHFNIPKARHRKRDRLVFGIIWMIVAVFCPEGLLAAAIYQHIDASLLEGYASLYLQSKRRAKRGWLTVLFRRYVRKEGGSVKDLELNTTREFPFGPVHASYATMGGFAFDRPASSKAGESSSTSSTRRDVLNSQGFFYILQNFPDIIPDISRKSITDRAESPLLRKVVLIVQVGWFCVSCLSRLIQHLPLSLLEVTTAAHGFCTLLTYFIWWSKPQNVAEPTPIGGDRAREVHALLKCSADEYSKALDMARGVVAEGSLVSTNTDEQDRIVLATNALRHLLPNPEARPENPFHCAFWSSSPVYIRCYLLPATRHKAIPVVVASVFYGLPHFLGWSTYFPTTLERQIWRVSTCAVTGSGFFFAVVMTPLGIIDWELADMIVTIMTTIVCVVASGLLIAGSLRQLFFLEPAAYQLVNWSNFWPRFS